MFDNASKLHETESSLFRHNYSKFSSSTKNSYAKIKEVDNPTHWWSIDERTRIAAIYVKAEITRVFK